MYQSCSVAGFTRASTFCTVASPRTSQPASSSSFTTGASSRGGARVDQQRFGRAADAGAAQLRVLHDLARHVELRIAVDIHVTNAFEMADHRYSRLALHARDQALAAARHDHVDVVSHRREQVADGRAVGGRHELNTGGRQTRGLQSRDQTGMNGAARMHALRAAAQDGRVAGLQAQRARIAGHVGTALVNDADDAERHAHARDVEAVGPRPARDLGADRIWQRGDFFDALRHGLDAFLIEREPVEHRARQIPWRAPPPGRGHSRRESRRARAQRRGDVRECEILVAVLASASTPAAAAASRPSRSMTGFGGFRRWRLMTGSGVHGSEVSGRVASSATHQHEIVAVDHLGATAKTDQRLDVGAAFADDARRILVVVGDHAARDFHARRDRARSPCRRARSGR